MAEGDGPDGAHLPSQCKVSFQRKLSPRISDHAKRSVRTGELNFWRASQNAELHKQLDALSQGKQSAESNLTATRNNSTSLAAQLKALKERVESDDSTINNLSAQVSLTNDREGKAEQKLQEAEQKLRVSQQTLVAVKSELATLHTSRTEDDGKAASQSIEFAELSRRVQVQEEVIDKQQKLLSVDSDVRNLMAARNLHITDIFDVDGKGKRKSAFGRVFYTEG